MSYAQAHVAANGEINSDVGHNSTAAMYDDDQEDNEISSQPLMPYVGMEFDSVDDAKTLYNEYAFKMGFGTRICASKKAKRKVLRHLSRWFYNVCTQGSRKVKMIVELRLKVCRWEEPHLANIIGFKWMSATSVKRIGCCDMNAKLT